MFLTALMAIVGVAVVGLIWAFCLRSSTSSYLLITGKEFAAAMTVISIIVLPIVLWAGSALSTDSALTYTELRSGVELKPEDHITKCYAGESGSSASSGESNCQFTFVSGSYSYIETYTENECTTDSKGNQSCTPVIKTRTEWADIYTPYATVEHSYNVPWKISDRPGNIEYPGAYLDAHPVRFSSRTIPSLIPRGAPADWLDANAHFDAGDARPVKDLFDYKNFILASADASLAAYSSDINRYLKQKILPDYTANILTNPISSHYTVKQVSFVGVKMPNPAQWQVDLMRFNAALGSKLQGDLDVVLINSKLVDDPHSYLKAFRAYSLGDHFGKRALAKNAIILVIGTSDNATIDWAQAATGMPFGNNIMLQAMQNNLAGQKLDPELIFGHPRTVITPSATEGGKDVTTVTHPANPGILENTMFTFAPFARPCMECKNGKGVGYSNLVDKIEPSTGWKIGMIMIVLVLSLPFWWAVARGSFFERKTPTINRMIRRSSVPDWSNR